MFGICHTSMGVMELLLDRTKFHVCAIEKPRPKKGNDDGYNPEEAFQEFLKTKSGGRVRVALVYGYSTLKNLTNKENVKYVVFDAPQILAKHGVEIFDSSQPAEGSGTWNLYRKTPSEINLKIEETAGGYEFKQDTPRYALKDILERVAGQLSKPEPFKIMVAKYVCGMVKKSIWVEKMSALRKRIKPEDYEMLLGWLGTFAPDALCLAYMDCVIHAPKRCGLYADALANPKNMTQDVFKKFNTVAVRACQTADAEYEDFMYLVETLPPLPEYSEKFLFPLPKYMITFRKKYPLLKPKNKEPVSKLELNT